MVSWTELRDLLGRAPELPVVGRHTSVRPRRDNGQNWPPPSPVRLSARFAHRPPHDWFVEYDNGDVSIDAWDPEDGRRAEDFPAGLDFGPEFPWDLDPSPYRLITGGPGPVLAEATAVAEPTPVRHDGRDAWAVILRTPSLACPLRVVVDAGAGILLAVEVEEAGYREELTELDFPAELPDSRFQWNNAVEAAEEAHRRRRDEVAAYYDQRPLPVPAFWPGGLDHAEPGVFDGDLATGLLAIDLYNDDAPDDTPTMATLIRQRPNTPLFEPGWVSDPQAFVHHWQDGTWQWTLALWGRPLSPDELDRVIDSMPAN
ncbi:hypothetical protein [Streptomyces prunicolor]|uniref:Uncharacterized protein n=1 Tax=Streptomyces prunicolor TaxID=67348 RepID=A0ABU4F2R1_9ACTN|nr:hypothetical protein [Streptomyces prunicolor]MCX5234872.1 hypothetical protein [Streptomyces prunicolor]MDV7214867.1 hypothetical protein [Streptomyces prunicolor]